MFHYNSEEKLNSTRLGLMAHSVWGYYYQICQLVPNEMWMHVHHELERDSLLSFKQSSGDDIWSVAWS